MTNTLVRNSMLTLSMLLLSVASFPAANAQVLVDDNFNSGTPGDDVPAPGGGTSPFTHDTDRGNIFVAQSQLSDSSIPSPNATNPFDGNGAWLYDYTTGSPGRYYRGFTPTYALMVQFDLANGQITGSSSTYYTLRLTNSSEIGTSSTQSPFDIDMRGDGSLSIEGDSNDIFNNQIGAGMKLSVYININTTGAVSTTDVNGAPLTIAASTFVVYGNTTNLGTWGFDSGSTNFNSALGIGNVVFNSGTTPTGDIVIDNLLVQAIPEPGHYVAFFASACLLFVGYRRYKGRAGQ